MSNSATGQHPHETVRGIEPFVPPPVQLREAAEVARAQHQDHGHQSQSKRHSVNQRCSVGAGGGA